MEFALGLFKAAIILAHVFLSKLYLGPQVGQLVTVIEAHEHTL